MLCKHGGNYRGHGKGEEPAERLMTASTKMDYPVSMKMRSSKVLCALALVVSGLRASVYLSMLVIIEVPDATIHNHVVEEGIAAFYPGNRRLSARKSAQILQMLATRTAPRFVATAINAACQLTVAVGIITNKNISM